MSIKKIRQERKKEREEISRKIAAGQTLGEHIDEVSVFDKEALMRSSAVMKINGMELEFRPGCPTPKILSNRPRRSHKAKIKTKQNVKLKTKHKAKRKSK